MDSATSRTDRLIAGAAAALTAAAVLGVAHQPVEHSDAPAIVVESHGNVQVVADGDIVVPGHVSI